MEIEKKFLCTNPLKNLNQYPKAALEQGYISIHPVIRIRKAETCCFVTMKGKGHLSRKELELSITPEQYAHLLKKVEGSLICKDRYYIPLDHGLTAELDIYHGRLQGLLTVEVEFSSEEEACSFIPPSWFGEDITYDPRYKNNQLAIYGLPSTFSQ